MRGAYCIDGKKTAVSAAATMCIITSASGKPVWITSAYLTFPGANVTNQQLEAEWAKITSLGTPTGTSQTPSPFEQGDQAAASTVTVFITASEPTYSTAIVYGHQGFSSLAGWYFNPLPEERILIPSGGSWGLRLLGTVTSTDIALCVNIIEVG
jgi:hypothetical protein